MKTKPELETLLRENPQASQDMAASLDLARAIEVFKGVGLFGPRYDLASPFGRRTSMNRLSARISR